MHVLIILMLFLRLSAAEPECIVGENEDASWRLSFEDQDLHLLKGGNFNLTLNLELMSNTTEVECLNVSFVLMNPDIGDVTPYLYLCPNDGPWSVEGTLKKEGKTILKLCLQEENNNTDTVEAYTVLNVALSDGINVAADVIGWIYTIAWDISFLPQIIHNWKRKSVSGLSFDFLTFNFVGFFSYLMFNIGMLWIPVIKDEFAFRHPYAVMHVRLNDIIFPLYALVCTAAQITQCFFYQRSSGQRVSITCRIITGLLLLSALVYLILTLTLDNILWLDFFYWLSYIKLAITTIKYTPQLYLNFRNKSTAGWSIWNVILDFTGGSLSLVQMLMLSGNYDDWYSIITDPAKLGLGVLSIFFNIFFFIQHYCLYGSKEAVQTEAGSENDHKDGSAAYDNPGVVQEQKMDNTRF